MWAVKTYERAGGRRTYGVRWVAGGESHHRTFTTRALADGFRSELITAARQGHPFDVETGLPPALADAIRRRSPGTRTLSAFVDAKWHRAAPRSRQSTADALASVTAALLPTGGNRPEPRVLRAALYGWAFNSHRRAAGPADSDELADAARWVERNSPLLAALNERATARRVLDSLTVRMDGQPAAANTVARRRAVLYNALEYAVELDRLPANPLSRVKWKAPKVAEVVDVRTVVNHDQARALLAAVGQQPAPGLRWSHSSAACTTPPTARPKPPNCAKPTWCCPPATGPASCASTPRTRPPRLPGRTTAGGSRVSSSTAAGRKSAWCPARPTWSELLRRHLAEHGTAPDGRLFRGERGGPISDSVYGRVWNRARSAALTPAEAASPLADRPYAFRHAAVSTWLNAGVDPALVAEWAGHSVHVLLRVYAKCVSGRDALARDLVTRHLEGEARTSVR